VDRDRRQPHGEPELVVITAFRLDQRPIHIVEEEVPLQLGPSEPARETAIRRRLIVGQELNRQRVSPAAASAHRGGTAMNLSTTQPRRSTRETAGHAMISA
jgi:hypothetical protein